MHVEKMDDIKEKIKEKKYQNWVKSTLGLEQTNKAVQEYVEQKFKAYTNGKVTLQHKQNHLTSAEITHIKGTEYIRHSLNAAVSYTEKGWEWNYTKYSCRDCKSAFEKILSLHRKGKGFKKICWENCANTTHISLEWAIAKIFMPHGNKANRGPSDTDPFAMFSVMLMCDLFSNNVQKSDLEKLKNARNTLFHSSDNIVTDKEQKEYFDAMISLLKCTSNDQEVSQETRDKINEDICKMENLRTSDITMTMFDDLEEALRIKRTGIYYDFEKSLCENDPENLKEILKLAEQIGGDMQLLKKHLHDLNNIDKYKTEIEELRKERSGVRAAVEKIPSVVGDIKEKNRHFRDEVDDMKKDFKRLTNEVQNSIMKQLLCVPSTSKLELVKNKASDLAAELRQLKQQQLEYQSSLSQNMGMMSFQVGQWKRAIRVEISQLESEGVIFVVIVTVALTFLFRLLLFFA